MKRITLKYLIIIFIISLPVSAQEFGNWGVTAYGGVSFPAGDLYNTGYGGAAGVIYDFNYNARFTLTLGYTQWEVDEAAVNKTYKNNGGHWNNKY